MSEAIKVGRTSVSSAFGEIYVSEGLTGIYISPSDAPAVAAALLNLAGVPDQAALIERLVAGLQAIVDSYEATSELHTSAADCAANLYDHAVAALAAARAYRGGPRMTRQKKDDFGLDRLEENERRRAEYLRRRRPEWPNEDDETEAQPRIAHGWGE